MKTAQSKSELTEMCRVCLSAAAIEFAMSLLVELIHQLVYPRGRDARSTVQNLEHRR